jgi:hypothetical protein
MAHGIRRPFSAAEIMDALKKSVAQKLKSPKPDDRSSTIANN